MSVKMAQDVPLTFVRFCDEAGVRPTQRQYNRWLRGEGAARTAAEKTARTHRKLRAELKGPAGGAK